MNRLDVKLTLAFVVVASIAVGLVAYLSNRATASGFESYVNYSATSPPPMVRNALTRYYLERGDWSGVQLQLQQLAELWGGRMILTDNDGRVLADSAGQTAGRMFSEDGRVGVALGVGGRMVGTLYYLTSLEPPSSPDGMGGMMGGMMGRGMWAPSATFGVPERSFLQGVTDTFWLAGVIAAVLGGGLAMLLVRQITRPLGALTAAAGRVASGDLSQRVEVRSRDEVGLLGEAFNTMAESLARNEHLRRQMAADIAHELRTPLAVIQGNLEAMRDGVVPATAGQLASVHEESLLLSRLVDDLRELSLAEAGQLPLQKAPVELVELARRAVAKVEGRAQAQGVEVVVDRTALSGAATVIADPDRISQVLHNLLDNAMRHTPKGGRITVSLVCDGSDESPASRLPHGRDVDWVKVSVADTGEGIAADDLELIFDRFYRADKSRARSSGGSGIGLAIVKQLVEAHGGFVKATSTPGEGSTFSFALPQALARASVAAQIE